MKDVLQKKGSYSAWFYDTRLVLAYERETFSASTVITSSQPCSIDESGLTFEIEIAAHDAWRTDLNVSIVLLGNQSGEEGALAMDRPKAAVQHADEPEALARPSPVLECDWKPLQQAYDRSLVDLAALRFSPISAGRHSLPAAGLPWFMTMFDATASSPASRRCRSRTSSRPPRCASSACVRARGPMTSGDEDPGRILHEMRYGEITVFEERPHSPYYGCADATPLYVVLLDEYERWTGDTKLVRELEHEARVGAELDR